MLLVTSLRDRFTSLGGPLRAVFGLSATLLLIAGPVSAQLTDIQAGPNFFGADAFGAHHTESLDVGDADNDGDLDVIVGNGGDSGPQANRIYINQGGLQAGTEGVLVNETATRFAGIPLDTTRDMEFVDIDNDGDLDILSVNRGSTVNGQVSRWYVNQGGLQGGTIGVYVDDTDARWGDLVSVDPDDELAPVDGTGPFGDWSCDCDFGDLDDDGDLDLFFSSYGPAMNGAVDSRIFLNDGAGVFDELWPWADAGADTRLHTLNVDLADFDGDFDLDIFASSRDSQARVYVNNLRDPMSDSPFHDITQAALLDTGAGQAGQGNYDAEYGDLDGDGDFDVWMTNYAGVGFGLEERMLRNIGPGAGVGFRFASQPGAIRGDPAVDENEADLLDFDGDGDLDVYMSNFLGTNSIYTSGMAQGLTPAQGLYHRNGFAGAGGLAPWAELSGSNSGTSRAGTTGDIDGDGDTDVLRAQDGGQMNTLVENTLGVPDTHAPTFQGVSSQCDKPEGTPTIVHAAVRDNSSWYIVDMYATDLVYTVNGGPKQSVDMFAQGGMQFRGVIPAVAGDVAYWIECTDRAGNTGVSAVQVYEQSGLIWQTVGPGTPGELGIPKLNGTGTWEPGSAVTIDLTDAAPDQFAALFYGFSAGPQPIAGGFLVPNPALGPVIAQVGPGGTLTLPVTVPRNTPCGFSVWMQWLIADDDALGGIAVSTALKSRGP